MSDVLHQRIVPFHGDEVVAVQHPDSTVYVLFAHLCENLGLTRSSQVRRVRSHAVLRKGLILLPIQTESGTQDIQCLRLDLLPLWLSGVHIHRVKPELQAKLEHYQHEAATVVGVGVPVVEADGQLEIAEGQLRRLTDDVRPAACRAGRGAREIPAG